MGEYYCKNCDAEIKATDTTCPKCGKNLSEVGRRIEITVTATVGVSASVETELTKKQRNIIQKAYEAIKNELAKKEIESFTFNFGVVSVTIKNKKET